MTDGPRTMNETVRASSEAPWFVEHLINNICERPHAIRLIVRSLTPEDSSATPPSPMRVTGSTTGADLLDTHDSVACPVAVVLALLYFFDHLLLKPWIKSRITAGKKSDDERKQKSDITLARWFFVHSFANVLVCITAVNSIRAVADDPTHALDGSVFDDLSLFGNASRWPLTIINSVHVYHMIGGFRLSGADYFHHLVFIPTIAFPGQVFRWGALGNFQAFFISGMPGGERGGSLLLSSTVFYCSPRRYAPRVHTHDGAATERRQPPVASAKRDGTSLPSPALQGSTTSCSACRRSDCCTA